MRFIVGFFVIMSVMSCQLNNPPPPSPTSNLIFATVTVGGTSQSQVPASPIADDAGPTVDTATATSTSTPTNTPTPTNTQTPVIITATPLPNPEAVINSPNGFLNVRGGPGVAYQPPLGTYNNGSVVEVLGKQKDTAGDLWWVIRFNADSNERGWIFAGYTNATNTDGVPWVTAPPLPTPVVVTPEPTPTPHAFIDSPDGFLTVRSGPGRIYVPELGAYQNGAVVPITGKQLSPDDNALWWQIPFTNSPNGQGWIFAGYTVARNIDTVPWINPPPTPTGTPTATSTATPTATPTKTPIPPDLLIVDWTITGRVIDIVTNEPIANASVQAILGDDGLSVMTLTDTNGDFSIVAKARNAGDLTLTLTAPNYGTRMVTVGPISPRDYDFAKLELTPEQDPAITWAISGQVFESGTQMPVEGAIVDGVLGEDGVQVQATTTTDGSFSMNGEARDVGVLTLTISALDYETRDFVSDQTGSRIYTFPLLQLSRVITQEGESP